MNISLENERRVATEDRRFREFQAKHSNQPFVRQPQPEIRGGTAFAFVGTMFAVAMIAFAGLASVAFVKTVDFLWSVVQ